MRSTAAIAAPFNEPDSLVPDTPGVDPRQGTAPTVLAIDRRPLLRSGLAGLARRALGCGAHAISDLDQAAAALKLGSTAARAVLLGLAPSDDPQQAVHDARRFGVPVICVLHSNDPGFVRQALAAGADGYLAFDTIDAETLEGTLAAAEAGDCLIAPALRSPAGRPEITPRCLEVLRSLAIGLHDDEIADQLGISTSSVRKHIASAQARLEARTRTQVVALVARDGLL